jgi:hypothetical protein
MHGSLGLVAAVWSRTIAHDLEDRPMFCRPYLVVLAVMTCFMIMPESVNAQPTYKLDVKSHLRPLAALRLEGGRVVRSELLEDPGFRLQYVFKKDNKVVTVVEARAQPSVEIPTTEPGAYTVTLELFYPAYKGGTEQKGAFRPVSEPVAYVVQRDAAGKTTIADLSSIRRGLFFGLAAGRQWPMPTLPTSKP